jgi:hypothetical protein
MDLARHDSGRLAKADFMTAPRTAPAATHARQAEAASRRGLVLRWIRALYGCVAVGHVSCFRLLALVNRHLQHLDRVQRM